MFKRGCIAGVLFCLTLGAASAEAQTITWVTPPPATVGSGSTFTVGWNLSGFEGLTGVTYVAWGQSTLLGRTPDMWSGNGGYEAEVTAPLIHGTLNVLVVVDLKEGGQILSTVLTTEVSALAAIGDLHAAITALQATVTAQAGEIAALQANSVIGLDGLLALDSHNGLPVARFTGINVQIVDGTGDTYAGPTDAQPNGLGNLIIGYDELRAFGTPTCSDGRFITQPSCESAGGTWALSHKTGAHTLVVGAEHNYSQHGGVVLGESNTVSSQAANVTGGDGNTASDWNASVSGGSNNTANRIASSVSGGEGNLAGATGASVSGGIHNEAIDIYASVSGGRRNIASGFTSSVSGGSDNHAWNTDTSISGGDFISNFTDGSVRSEGVILPVD